MKAYTDIEQSKKLAEILPIESADMYWWPTSLRYYIEAMDDGDFNEEEGHVRAWSLAALFSILPEGIIENYYAPNLQKEDGKYSIAYGNDELLCIADNPIDACYEMILKLHKQKLL